MNNPVLSICVVTRNRAEQLKDALESCLACQLPETTEFVVIDNASTDATAEVVQNILGRSGYAWIYEKNAVNLGAGRGRAQYFNMASGHYVYGRAGMR